MWKEYFVYDVTKALTAGTGVAFETINTKIDSDADFEFNKTTYVATNDRIKLKYKDDAIGRYLTKNAVDIKSVAGRNIIAIGQSNSFLPFIWPRPYIISAGAGITVEAADYSAAANTMRLVFHGAKIRNGEAPWNRKFRAVVPMVYNIGSTVVTASGTSILRIEIDMDSHFMVQKLTGIRTSDALVSISESARGRDWSNTAVHIDNIIGNGVFPNILPANRFIPRGSTLVVTIQDLSGMANTVDINLIGVKLYE